MKWKKRGTCKICQKRYVLKLGNILPVHKIKGFICSGSGQVGKDHKYERGDLHAK